MTGTLPKMLSRGAVAELRARVAAAPRPSVGYSFEMFWRATVRYGFMEQLDIPALLRRAHEEGGGIDITDVTYYVGHETIMPRDDGKGLPRWVQALLGNRH